MKSFYINKAPVGTYAICNKCWATETELVTVLRLDARKHSVLTPWEDVNDRPSWKCVLCYKKDQTHA